MLEPKARKILVIKFRHIGDVLLTAPLISTLKIEIPGVRVCAAVKQGTEAVLDGHPHLNALYVLPKKQAGERSIAFFIRYIKWLKKLRNENFDLVINATEGDRGILLGRISGARNVWSFKKVVKEKKWRQALVSWYNETPLGFNHTVLRDLSFTKALNLQEHMEVSLPIKQEVSLKIDALLYKNKKQPLIHIHPVSRWKFKSWKTEHVAALVDLFHQVGANVVLTSSSDSIEVNLITEIASLCKSANPINLAGKTTIQETAEISRISTLFVGVDSAPMHMAAAVNTSVIALFGPTGAYNWGPWPNSWDQNNVAPYPAERGNQYCKQHTVIQKNWPCVPCGRSGCEGLKKSACLDTLSAKEVFRVALRHLPSQKSQR